MTFIKPNQKLTFSSKRLFILGLIPIFCCLVLLIVLYNKTVETRHRIADVRNELQRIEGKKAELNDRVLSLFSRNNIETFVSEHGLQEDRSPRYILVDNTIKWEVASQY